MLATLFNIVLFLFNGKLVNRQLLIFGKICLKIVTDGFMI
ncbi:hypothetical protein SD77_0852 [Bacillus badius]|uniref:Uncharacterized protein n=1 Tax=Bacillus badius TaxID=1455 RepID=A0ABR5ASZ4_BACBA|nr:hypothetical protein SD78_2634 [Bacillus badius]KIL77873.1 hypothetical protein SD77_0852 [Bacillus badius]